MRKYQKQPHFRNTKKQELTMQSSELESGLPDEAEQESIVSSCFLCFTKFVGFSPLLRMRVTVHSTCEPMVFVI